MKISVVVPAYNEEKYIRSCIESLVKQNYEDFEVIVSLNACTDNTDGVVRGIMDEYEASEIVKIVHEDEKGVARARQRGVEAAEGKIIASADADTAYPGDWLNKLVGHFDDSDVALVYGSVWMKGGSWWLKFLAKHVYTWFMYISRLFGKDNVTGMNFAYRKEFFTKAGGYDLNLKSAEDIYLGQKLKKYGKVIFDPSIHVYTSPRRFEKGFWRFLWHHVKNYWRVFVLKKQPSDFEDIR